MHLVIGVGQGTELLHVQIPQSVCMGKEEPYVTEVLIVTCQSYESMGQILIAEEMWPLHGNRIHPVH